MTNTASVLLSPPPKPYTQLRSRLAASLGVLFSYRAMLAVGLALICFATVSGRFSDPDLWFHLKLGQIVWNTHSIPSTDLFSFTAYGHPWTAHEWLAELMIYGVYRLGGYTGLMLCFSMLVSVLIWLVYELCYRYSGNAMAAFLGGACAWFFATVGLAIRPHLIGYILLAAELLLLESASRNRRWLLALPPLFAFWVNCHGSFIFGIGVLAVFCACAFVNGRWGLIVAEGTDPSLRKWLLAASLLSVAALCVNPIGVRLLLYPLNTIFQQPMNMNAVEEWRAPDLGHPRTIGMVAALAFLLAAPLARKSEMRLRDLLLTSMAFCLASQHLRMIFVFGIVASPVLCATFAPLIGRASRKDHPIVNAVLMAACLLIMVRAFPTAADLRDQVLKANPVEAVKFVRQAGLSGPMLNEYVFGDYLIWAMPEQKVFIDGRGDVYDWTGVFAEYGRWATLSEDPNLLLNRRHIRLCLLSRGSPMARAMDLLPGWRRAYSDSVATIFVR